MALTKTDLNQIKNLLTEQTQSYRSEFRKELKNGLLLLRQEFEQDQKDLRKEFQNDLKTLNQSLRKAFQTDLKAQTLELHKEFQNAFREQNKHLSKLFSDLTDHLENTYATKDELENSSEELRDEIEDLKLKFKPA